MPAVANVYFAYSLLARRSGLSTMNQKSTIVTDPVGFKIFLPEALCQQSESLPEDCCELKQVLETPACIIELPNRQRCYFRSLAWNVTIQMTVVYREQEWEAVSWLRNPGHESIQQLLQTGTFIACRSLA